MLYAVMEHWGGLAGNQPCMSHLIGLFETAEEARDYVQFMTGQQKRYEDYVFYDMRSVITNLKVEEECNS